jgi:lysozyme
MGTLIDSRKGGAVSDDVVELMAREDIERNRQDLDKAIPWWRSLNPSRQLALEAMAYQLGTPNLLAFKKMLAALEAKNWIGAHMQALDSTWAEQTPARAKEVAALLRDG